MSKGKIVELKKTELKSYEETQIEWRIHDFVTSAESSGCIISPNFSAGDDSSLQFVLCRKSNGYPKFVSLYLWRGQMREYGVEFKFGFKTSDGSVRNFFQGTLPENRWCSDEVPTMKLSDLLSEESDLILGDVLCITCTLKREITHPTETVALESTKPSKLINSATEEAENKSEITSVEASCEKLENKLEPKGAERLAQNLNNLLENELGSDVILKNSDHEFRAHMAILVARSPVFASMFQHDMIEKKTGQVDISDCSTDGFQVFLRFLYTGNANTMSIDNVFDLYYIADKYQVDDLKAESIEFMKSTLSADTFCDVITLSLRHSESDLQNVATQFFCKNFKEIIKTVQWQKYLTENPIYANELFLKAVSA